MSAAVVSGAVAQLLQAQPKLTPLETKFALQFTAEFLESYGLIEQGAGSLNVALAVKLATSSEIEDSEATVIIANEEISASKLLFGESLDWLRGFVSGNGTSLVWGHGTSLVWGHGTSLVWGHGTSFVWGHGTSLVWGHGTSLVWGHGTSLVWGHGTSLVWGHGTSLVWGHGTSLVWGHGTSLVWGHGTSLVWGHGTSLVWGHGLVSDETKFCGDYVFVRTSNGDPKQHCLVRHCLDRSYLELVARHTACTTVCAGWPDR